MSDTHCPAEAGPEAETAVVPQPAKAAELAPKKPEELVSLGATYV
jgi:hypothetical protein